MRSVLTRTAAITLVAAGSVTGCGLLVLPAELPAVLDYLMKNTATFQVSDNGPLHDVATGTVVDELGDPDGCWAVYWRVESPRVSEGRIEVCEVLQFDAATSTLTRSVLHRVGSLGDVTIQRGPYTPTGENRFTFRVQTVEANLSGRMVDITDRYDTLPEYTVYATRSGDYLKTRFEMPPDDPRAPAGFVDGQDLVHRRFDCPAD